MPSTGRLKNNGARLSRLIIDQGTETMRMVFDSIHSPASLHSVLNSYYGTLSTIRVINRTQMETLFPPSGVLPSKPSTSNDYDITLLFILIRNICGLSAPTSTGGKWDELPPPSDINQEADLARIKYFRNMLYGHIRSTQVNDADFDIYWKEISIALVRLGADASKIAKMKTDLFDEDLYIGLLNEWYESDRKTEVIATENLKITEKIEGIVKANTRKINSVMVTLWILIITLSFYLLYPRKLSAKEPEFFYRQNLSNPYFVGRDWIFEDLEKILNTTARGVQLVADPGWGKSAIMERLVDTSLSSTIIHENIVGYYFCKYNERPTRNGERFVKNLTQLISGKISEFQEIVNNDKLINDELHYRCKDNPEKCFQKAIVEPLNKVNSVGRNNSFILIDALDECLEEEERHHSIIPIILSKIAPELPSWVKLIVTSRKQPLTFGKISKINGFELLEINVEDQRNFKDLHAYAEQTLQNFYPGVSSSEQKLPLDQLIDLALKSAKGNFLFLETILKYWQKYPDQMNAQSIPESLGGIYTASFTRRYKEADFVDFEPFLEVILAANSPPMLFELDKILRYHNKNFKTRKIAKKISEYFKSDIDNEPLEFHHQFFAEWLTDQTEMDNGIVIEISKGHQYIVEYLFHFYQERQTTVTYEELSELCTHILRGEKKSVANVLKLKSLVVSEVRDSSKRCILHDLAPKRDAPELIRALIQQFDSVDVLDDNGWTPALYAVRAGSYENLELFINNKANINHAVKRTFCFFWDFMVFRESYVTKSSMNFVAAFRGDTKIATLLVREGARIDKADECGWKPLYVAVVMGHFEIVELYINRKAEADAISLHHAVARNHTKIVEFLLNSGVRDECLPCNPGNKSWCRHNLNRFHHCFCETAFHAAVSRDYLEIANLILRYGNASVNCKHGSGRTPLMEAFTRKNSQMIKLLINKGAEIEAECESSNSDLFHDCSFMAYKESEWLYSRYCNQPICYNGNQLMELALAYGVWKTVIPFISIKNRWAAGSLSEVTAAAIYDQVDFINATYGNKINSIPNVETMLRYVAVCHSVEILQHLLKAGDLTKFRSVYEDEKTLLHYATLGSSKRKTESYVTQSCANFTCICPNKTRARSLDEKRLKTVTLLTEVLVSDKNKQDKYGRTALHYAAVHALPEVVESLINAGADWSVKDQRGDTAVEYALQERPLDSESYLPCQLTSDQVFRVCSSTLFDEAINYILQNVTIKKCDMKAKKLLDGLIKHRLPLSLYELLKSGLDVNCAREHFKTYLNETVSINWNRRHGDILEVFKIFEIDVEEACDVPFGQSELHLMAYLGTPSIQIGNLFRPSVNNSLFPLQRFVENHPKGVEILNECYDKEGYLVIHRAVQGTNLDAVSWFIEIGVDLSTKTKSNSTALVLATYNYPSSSTFSLLDNANKRIFEILLQKSDDKGHASFRCNTEIVDFSPLHVAASRGMGILNAFRQKMPLYPLICTNSHGIQPIYLAYLFHATNPYMSRSDTLAFQDLGLTPETGPSKFPEREAEYHLIYNQFYRAPPEGLGDMLNHDGLFECPGINELLSHKTIIQKYRRLQPCASRCWQSAFEASRTFSEHFSHVYIQNNISSPFTDKSIIEHHMTELRFYLVKMFQSNLIHLRSISIVEKKLWRKVKKAHSCVRHCVCFKIMHLLQETFTSKPLEYKKVGEFIAKRMGWTDTSPDGDVKYRWPFSFFLKKALGADEEYKYLEILSPKF